MEQWPSLNSNGRIARRRRRRRILRRALVVPAVVVVAVVAGALWAARALPRIAAAQISRLTNTHTEMGAFDFHRDGSVSIDGLVICPERGKPSDDDAVLRARSVRVRFDRRSLLTLAPRLTEIRIEDFILDAQLDWDTGRWNIGGLRINRTAEKSDADFPAVILQNGKLRYSKASGGRLEVVMSVPIEAQFRLADQSRRRYSFQIKTAKLSGGYGESHLEGSWRPGELTLAGGLSSTDIPSLERAWAADVIAAQLTYDSRRDYSLNLRIRNAHSKQSPEVDAFRMLVPASLGQSGPVATVQSFFARYRPSGTVEQVTLDAKGNFNDAGRSEILGAVVCSDVSICDRKFPYTIDHLAGRVDFTQSSVVVHRLTGKHGDVDLVIDGSTTGYGENRRHQYRVTSDNMILDQALYAALQPEQKRLWDAFKPSGVIGVDYRLTRTSPTEKRRYASVELHQVAATYERFPYPLEGLTGTLRFDSESIVASDIVSQAHGRRIRVNGRVTQRDTPHPMYYIDVDSNDIPLDNVLAKALPGPYRKLYEQFDANGVADCHARVFTTDDGNNVGPVGFFVDVAAAMDSFKLRKWPALLHNVSADVSLTPESMSIKRFVGQYGRSPVSLTGGVRLGREDKPQQVQLKITAQDAPLGSGIEDLLPESFRRGVAAFAAQGNVNLAVDVTKTDANDPLDYSVVVECLGNSLKHERFGYPLQDVHGRIVARPGRLTFNGIRATPAVQSAGEPSGEIRIDGYLDLTDTPSNRGVFTVAARDIPFTEELGAALSGHLRNFYRDLSPQGRFDLDLKIPVIAKTARNENRFDFQGALGLQDCRLTLGGAPTDLSGDLRIAGAYDVRAGLSSGRMELDARRIAVLDKPITDLRAEVIFDPDTRTWVARDFIGDCCDGKVWGNLQVCGTAAAADANSEASSQSAINNPRPGEYLLQAAFDHVDLQKFLTAGKTSDAATDYGSGTMNACLSLGARLGGRASRLGICRIDVVDMRVGKVSPLAAILSVLQLSEPTDYVFDRMQIESCLRQDTLLVQKLDMSGRNVAFTGSGTMNTSSRQIDLMLTARGRRVAAAEPSVLESLAEGLGGAVVRMEVTGTADSPTVTTKALPVIEDSLKILGSPR